ncbi:MAG: hypothetical protein ABI566_06630 [Pseudolysinimonas sp.]
MTEPPDAVATPRRRLWRIAGITAAVVVPVVTVATIVIPIVIEAGDRHTSVGTLVVNEGATAVSALDLKYATTEFGPFPGQGFSVAIPADAPFDTFPLDPEGQEGLGCTQAQVDWLLTYRVTADGGSQLYDVRNSATAGSALRIQNVHVAGEFRPQDPDRFYFYCNGGGAGTEPDFVVLDVTLGDTAPAVVQYDYRTGSPIPPGTIFSMDLAPGELVQMYVNVKTLEPAQDFFGQIIADVVVDGVTTPIVLQEGWLWRSPPSIRQFEAQWTEATAFDDYDSGGWGDPTAWHLMCVHQQFEPGTDWFDGGYPAPVSGDAAPCTVSEWADEIRKAPREF